MMRFVSTPIRLMLLLLPFQPVRAGITLDLEQTVASPLSNDESGANIDLDLKGKLKSPSGIPDAQSSHTFSLMDQKSLLTIQVTLGDVSGKMAVDTGSPYLWIATDACTGCAIDSSLGRYPKSLPPYHSQTLQYGKGDTKGNIEWNKLILGSNQVDNVAFLAVNSSGRWPLPSTSEDIVGIFSLGHGVTKWLDNEGTPYVGPMQALKDAGKIDSSVFGISAKADKLQLTIGGVDDLDSLGLDVSRVATAISDAPLTYRLLLQSMSLQGSEIATTSNRATLDTGASQIWGPESAVDTIYERIGAILFNDPDVAGGRTNWVARCKPDDQFSFKLGFERQEFEVGYEAIVNPTDFVTRYIKNDDGTTYIEDGRPVKDPSFNNGDIWCYISLANTTNINLGSDWNSSTDWLVGLPFLRKVYSTWNFATGEIQLYPYSADTSDDSSQHTMAADGSANEVTLSSLSSASGQAYQTQIITTSATAAQESATDVATTSGA